MRDLGTSPTKKAAPRGSSGSVLLDTFNETRFKSNIDLRLSNRQFVGVKLIIPLGD
ncbi:MAG: hypothetical protein PCFJNLEI_02773 [Verrucomicrobiae bacterium]|nr:hypothetical protein [Verrucomicrobiae bacterium]